MSSDQISTGPGLYRISQAQTPFDTCDKDVMVSNLGSICSNTFKKDTDVESHLFGIGRTEAFQPLPEPDFTPPVVNNTGAKLGMEYTFRGLKRENSTFERIQTRNLMGPGNVVEDKSIYTGTPSRIVHRYA